MHFRSPGPSAQDAVQCGPPSMSLLSLCCFFFLVRGTPHDTQKCLGQGLNPSHSSNPNHSNDNARSFNWQATEELQLIFLRVFLCFSWGKKVPRPRTLLTLPSPQSSPTDAVGGSTTTARTHTHTYPPPTLAKTIMILEHVTAC